VKIIAGKGLRIESVHPSDEGTYICEASNVMGTISAGAFLQVRGSVLKMNAGNPYTYVHM
jgi:hypothetical protein